MTFAGLNGGACGSIYGNDLAAVLAEDLVLHLDRLKDAVTKTVGLDCVAKTFTFIRRTVPGMGAVTLTDPCAPAAGAAGAGAAAG